MAKPKRLTRVDVHKQIDAFRGIFKRNPDGKLSAEQWAEVKRAEMGLSPNGAKTAKKCFDVSYTNRRKRTD